jgi:predicted RNA binding protein YcfA (HicA-like mRNA interferase family)
MTRQTRLSPVSLDALVKRLRELGFEGPHAGGKHLFMLRGDLRLTIPNPHRREISQALLTRILKQAGIDRDSWFGE